MADLTVSFNATGTINGRTYSLAHSFTIEDVVDYGRKASSNNGDPLFDDIAKSGEATHIGAAPEIILFGNEGKDHSYFLLTTASAKLPGFCIPPGEFGVVCGESNTVLDVTSTATSTTLSGVSEIFVGGPTNIDIDTNPWVFYATT